MNTSGAINQLMLNGLQECVQYSISVRAYTSQGPGPFSVAVLDSSLNRESIIMGIHGNYLLSWATVNSQVPQPPEVLPRALTATSANITWSCPLEKNYSVISYFVNVTVDNPNSYCVHGQNLSYYITVPGYQRYIYLMNMSLCK